MSTQDVRKIKKLARRIGVNDSEVVRFAVKSMLERVGPLHDPDVGGHNLLPVFVESGRDLVRFFELDVARLDSILNEGVEPARRIDRDDIALLAMHGLQRSFAEMKLQGLAQNLESVGEATDTAAALRRYLFDKYLYRSGVKISASGGANGRNGVHGSELGENIS